MSLVRAARVVDVGRREYSDVWELQKQLVTRRQADEIPDTLLLVEHPDVITLGRRREAERNVLARIMPVFEVERGGDVTYHGPGQLVGYPILKFADDERDLHRYLRNLEEALIGICGAFGLVGGRNPGWTGAWIGRPPSRKIASIGIAVRRWVTLHGFALNVSTDLSRFAAIHPCGLKSEVMTSLSQEAGRPISLAEVKPFAVAELGRALQRDFRPAAADRLL